ncbi:hypothetical protein TNCV_2039361 [Trichonephila clavipes]|nr:hypothetical protein TNCV_2039361 [Trichonephila clavipes]
MQHLKVTKKLRNCAYGERQQRTISDVYFERIFLTQSEENANSVGNGILRDGCHTISMELFSTLRLINAAVGPPSLVDVCLYLCMFDHTNARKTFGISLFQPFLPQLVHRGRV